uniref:Lamina-associated polypeptide 2 alpha C-terminal domain-containing protein n=1 Tax=Xenopus tropicalis TaxID=8364 RepID=A0A1B8XUS1_XENTR
MESILKRSYTQAAAILRPAVASAGLARTARHWALELARHPPASKQQLQLEVDKLSTTLSFLAESALEITRLAAKATSNAVVARRALWLRHWSGDTASKMRLLSLKFTGESLFGPDLKQIISDVTGGKSTFLPTGKKQKFDSSNRYSGRRGWNSQSRPFRPFRSGFRSSPADQGARRGRPTWQQHARSNTKKPNATKPNSA